MLLTAALTSLALMVPVNVPSTIEATQTTWREGSTVRSQMLVLVDGEQYSESHTSVHCDSDTRAVVCDALEESPDVVVRTARTEEDGIIWLTDEVRVGDYAYTTGRRGIPCDGSSIVTEPVCTVYDVVKALDEQI